MSDFVLRYFPFVLELTNGTIRNFQRAQEDQKQFLNSIQRESAQKLGHKINISTESSF